MTLRGGAATVPRAPRCSLPASPRLAGAREGARERAELRRGGLPGPADVAQAPSRGLVQQRPEVAAARGGLVEEADGPVPVGDPAENAALLEASQPLGQRGRGDAFRRLQELLEEALPDEERVPEHEEGPAVAQDLERARDRALRSAADAGGSGAGHPEILPP